MTPDQVQEKWEDWVEKIKLDLFRLNRDWLMWTDMAPTLQRAGGDLVFLGHYAQMYIDSQAMMVRRLVDVDRQSVSLGRLLEQLADRPDVTTATVTSATTHRLVMRARAGSSIESGTTAKAGSWRKSRLTTSPNSSGLPSSSPDGLTAPSLTSTLVVSTSR